MARHAAPQLRRGPVLRAALTLTAAGAALGAGAAAAQAATPPAEGLTAPGQALVGSLQHAAAPAGNLKIDPLANTGVDPLDNSVGTQIADFKPVSSAAATGPLARGASLNDLLRG
ncbi:hypothetical protein [Streptomyces sp. NBC_01465]|uniref:hypothetical protein n=1 Tax=Streptomyces sp. NBC_01465 TaxID=2903878 RepID=UPI002E33E144|nr:hypothetical protein [Streptomyces sp. NBC_01465]